LLRHANGGVPAKSSLRKKLKIYNISFANLCRNFALHDSIKEVSRREQQRSAENAKKRLKNID
jgi:hypothetical protein